MAANGSAYRFEQIAGHTSPTQTVVVAVAGIGTAPPCSWQDTSKPSPSRLSDTWFDAIPHSAKAPGMGVFSYQNGTEWRKTPWQGLLDQGETFLEELLGFIRQSEFERCPVLLIAHSFGGVIVKEALHTAYQRQESLNCREFLRRLAGVILLGTPHSSPDQTKWVNAGAFVGKVLGKKIFMPSEDAQRWATSFDLAGIHIPILSVYELQETKVSKGKLGFKARKAQVTDKTFVTTGMSSERVLAIDTDHQNLCHMDVGSSYFKVMSEFVDGSLEDARLNIARESPIYDKPSMPAGDPWSLVKRTRTYDSEVSETTFQTTTVSDLPTPNANTNTTSGRAGSSEMSFDVVLPSNLLPDVSRSLTFPIHSIPVAKNPAFFGRQDVLSQIDATFFSTEVEQKETQTRTFAICGPGGIGKTQVATAFVHSRKDHFNAIFWIHAASSLKLRDEFGQLAVTLGLVEDGSIDARDQVITQDLVKGWLANPRPHPRAPRENSPPLTWLIVFDNVDNPQVLEGFLPLGCPGCVLFTSRDPQAKNSLYLATAGVDLQPFSRQESSELLRKLTSKTGDASAVHERLGGLPLAITQMASVIIRHDLAYTEFVESYDEEVRSHGSELLTTNYPSPSQPNDYKETIWSVWALQSLRHGGTLLDVLSILDPDGIPEYILTSHSGTLKLVPGFPTKAFSYQKARGELLQSSLISKDSSNRRLLVHRLVQDAARARMDTERFRNSFHSALLLVSSVWQFEEFGWRHSVSRWKVCEELMPHILQLRRFGEHVKTQKGTAQEDYLLAKLLTDAAWYYHETGSSMESQPLFEFAQSICKSVKSTLSDGSQSEIDLSLVTQVDATIAELHHNLGCIGTETNQPAFTLEHFEMFNQMMVKKSGHKVHGVDHWLHISWNELGNAYMMNKRWREGERAFRTAIESARLQPNFQLTDVSLPYVNLGLACWLQKRHQEAMDTLLEGLKAREDVYGRDDGDSFITGRFLHALGNVTASRGELDLSCSYHFRALRHYERTIGRNHHRTGDVHVKVSEHLMRLGNFEEAQAHLSEALRIFGERSYYLPEKARALFKNSILLTRAGREEEGEANRNESLKLYGVWFKVEHQSLSTMTEDDMDESVMFWSR